MFSTIIQHHQGVRLADPAPASERVGTRTLCLALGWLLRQQLRQLRRRRERVASVHARAGGGAAAAVERPAQREDAPREQRTREAEERHLAG